MYRFVANKALYSDAKPLESSLKKKNIHSGWIIWLHPSRRSVWDVATVARSRRVLPRKKNMSQIWAERSRLVPPGTRDCRLFSPSGVRLRREWRDLLRFTPSVGSDQFFKQWALYNAIPIRVTHVAHVIAHLDDYLNLRTYEIKLSRAFFTYQDGRINFGQSSFKTWSTNTQIPKSVEKNFAKCRLQILSADYQRKCNNLLAEYDGRLTAEIEQNLSLLGTREQVIFITRIFKYFLQLVTECWIILKCEIVGLCSETNDSYFLFDFD